MDILLKNKKAEFNYEILDKYIAGISLLGMEVKSIRQKHGSFKTSFVTERNDELFLKNFYLPPYQEKNIPFGYDKYRDRKLLLTKREIKKIKEEIKKPGNTLIPLEFVDINGKIKLIFALAKGKKKYDKRESLKKKDSQRDIDRIIKRINSNY